MPGKGVFAKVITPAQFTVMTTSGRKTRCEKIGKLIFFKFFDVNVYFSLFLFCQFV
jgi:hypothetical protein